MHFIVAYTACLKTKPNQKKVHVEMRHFDL